MFPRRRDGLRNNPGDYPTARSDIVDRLKLTMKSEIDIDEREKRQISNSIYSFLEVARDWIYYSYRTKRKE